MCSSNSLRAGASPIGPLAVFEAGQVHEAGVATTKEVADGHQGIRSGVRLARRRTVAST